MVNQKRVITLNKFLAPLALSVLALYSLPADAKMPSESDKNMPAITTTDEGAQPARPKTVKQPKFTVTLKDNVVYVNGLKLGTPEHEVKEELDQLGYDGSGSSAFQLNYYSGTDTTSARDSVRAKLRQKALVSISTHEHDIHNSTKNEIIDSLKASFGAKIDCQESRHPRMELISCNYTHKAPGEWTSLTVSFRRTNELENYSFHITLK